MSVKTKTSLDVQFLALQVTLFHDQTKEIKTTTRKQTIKMTLLYCETETLLFECAAKHRSFHRYFFSGGGEVGGAYGGKQSLAEANRNRQETFFSL